MQFDELFKKRSNHIKPGLERMIRAVAAMNIPDLLDTPAILIGGTNGKGGTAAELWNLLRAAGVPSSSVPGTMSRTLMSELRLRAVGY